jgi:hypothetical protein
VKVVKAGRVVGRAGREVVRVGQVGVAGQVAVRVARVGDSAAVKEVREAVKEVRVAVRGDRVEDNGAAVVQVADREAKEAAEAADPGSGNPRRGHFPAPFSLDAPDT